MPRMQYVGIDWAYRRAAWCAKSESGEIRDEGVVPADEDGLAKLVLALGPGVVACDEMMSGAVQLDRFEDRLPALVPNSFDCPCWRPWRASSACTRFLSAVRIWVSATRWRSRS